MAGVLQTLLTAVLEGLGLRLDTGGGDARPSETSLQNNLDRAVEYRREYYKYGIGIGTALLAFTVSFPPQLTRHPEVPWLLFVGWAGLGLAVLAGVRVHMVWAKFFVSFRDYDNKGWRAQGLEVRDSLNSERRFLDVAQMAGLAIGVGCIVIFTAINMQYIALKKDEAAAPAAAAGADANTAAPATPPAAAPAKLAPPVDPAAAAAPAPAQAGAPVTVERP